ncbi:MAG: hypothetical protein ABI091_30415 [Ferruginibacter sp.]
MDHTTEVQEPEIKEIDWDSFKCRCSSIHMAMADSRSNPVLTEKQELELTDLESKESLTVKQKEKLAELIIKKENCSKVVLSDTYVSYLMEEYSWRTESKVRVSKELMDIPQLQKGTIVEPLSLRLLSLVDGVEYKPNKDENGQRTRLYNDYLSGEIDAYVGNSIYEIEKLPDVKSIFDYPTFLCKITEPLTKANDLQVKGYMDITGSSEGFIGNCLVDIDSGTLEKLRWRLLGKLDVATFESPEFVQKWEIIERSLHFNKIPVHKRVFKKNVDPMSDFERQKLYDRVKVGREYLFNFHEMMQNINL